jgi:hypothetical protein
MAGDWTLTVRDGPRVERMRFDTLSETMDALEHRLDELTPGVRRRTIQVGRRRYDPASQVAVRAEVAGPGSMLRGVRGGVDLRGDGSAEAYTGRLKRTFVQLRPGETPYDGLRRVWRGLSPPSSPR